MEEYSFDTSLLMSKNEFDVLCIILMKNIPIRVEDSGVPGSFTIFLRGDFEPIGVYNGDDARLYYNINLFGGVE